MSFLFAVPESVATAATDLSGIGSAINAANTAAAGLDYELAGRRCR
ncbi:PE domain-containing protein [Mycobacterium sp.]